MYNRGTVFLGFQVPVRLHIFLTLYETPSQFNVSVAIGKFTTDFNNGGRCHDTELFNY
jgi:hypothetical protein